MTAPKDIIVRLRQIEVLQDVPEADLQWLADHSTYQQLDEGDYMFRKGTPADEMLILLEGEVEAKMERNGQYKVIGRFNAGDITGLLPYSRLKEGLADGQVLKPVLLMKTHREVFREMICDHHDLVQPLVSFMTTRVRDFTKRQQQDEKLMSLGKLSAGLAHELNNPASAIVRSSVALKTHLGTVPDKFKRVISMRLEPEQVDAVNNILFCKLDQVKTLNLSLMERTEREDDITDWLDEHGMGDCYQVAENYAEFGVTTDDLDAILQHVSDAYLPPVLEWLDNVMTTEKMVGEIEEASQRISGLVQSVKTYSHMDRGSDMEPVDLREGIRSTITMLGHKVKKNQVTVKDEMDDELPRVEAHASELNQVWTNLIDNALDAMPNGGTLLLKTYPEREFVKIEIADSGSGIPEDILPQIFDPFFTTKDIGQGTGLGLDIVQKIIQQHRADIKVDSRPGHTIFTICIPVKQR